MRRTRADRIHATERVVARRIRQLRDTTRGAKWDGNKFCGAHRSNFADRSMLGRCGHRRCVCHASQRLDWADDHRDPPPLTSEAA